MKEVIERQIEEILKLDISASTLSTVLFSQHGGLFSLLAQTEEERRIVSQSSLFQRANARLSALQLIEAAPLIAEVEKVRAAIAKGAAALPPPTPDGAAPGTTHTPSKSNAKSPLATPPDSDGLHSASAANSRSMPG